MKLTLYNFLASKEATDNEILFYWFMTRIIEGEEDPRQQFTLSKYDLMIMLRGTTTGAYKATSIPDSVKQWFDIGWVTEARLTVRLTPRALKVMEGWKDKKKPHVHAHITIKDKKVKALYIYLLGIFAGSNTMFYEEKFWGIGNHEDKDYHPSTKRLEIQEIRDLLNATQLDTRELL